MPREPSRVTNGQTIVWAPRLSPLFPVSPEGEEWIGKMGGGCSLSGGQIAVGHLQFSALRLLRSTVSFLYLQL